MANYLYRAAIRHTADTDVRPQDVVDTTDKNDFEGATKKPNAEEVTDVIISSTTFVIEKAYSAFDDFVTGDIVWSDVKYIDDGECYKLHLASETPL